MAPINLHITSRHEGTSITNQKHRRSPILMRQTKLPQHIMRGPVAFAVGVLLKQSLHHCGHDVAGGDCVDADAVLAPFCRETAGELEDAGFGGVVGGACEALLAWGSC